MKLYEHEFAVQDIIMFQSRLLFYYLFHISVIYDELSDKKEIGFAIGKWFFLPIGAPEPCETLACLAA